jgi:hypothetical protein
MDFLESLPCELDLTKIFIEHFLDLEHVVPTLRLGSMNELFISTILFLGSPMSWTEVDSLRTLLGVAF